MGGRRGRMTTLAQRQQLITLIDQATNAGARLHIACSEVSISKRTYRRWKADKDNTGDKRPIAVRAAPSNKLSDIERQAILNACNEPRFASLPPSQIVPTLLDEGIYHASESSFYRVLKGHNQLKPRGRAKAKNPRKPPETFIATKPCQVFCWDITYLPSKVRDRFNIRKRMKVFNAGRMVGLEGKTGKGGNLGLNRLDRTRLGGKRMGTG